MNKQLTSDVLGFNKSSLVELNNAQLRGTDSGITPSTVTPYVLFVGAVALGVAIGDAFDD